MSWRAKDGFFYQGREGLQNQPLPNPVRRVSKGNDIRQFLWSPHLDLRVETRIPTALFVWSALGNDRFSQRDSRSCATRETAGRHRILWHSKRTDYRRIADKLMNSSIHEPRGDTLFRRLPIQSQAA